MTLYIDADACPVKDEAERVATRHRIRMVLVSNGGIRPSANPLVESVYVGAGLDEADRWIADHAGPGDVVVTTDIPLAARVVETGAAVVKPDGQELTAANIGTILATRDLMADLRSADPFRQGGGRAFSKADRSRFLDVLDRVLRQLPLLSVMACRRLAVQRSTWALLLMCSILPGCSREAAPRDAADAGPRLRLLHAVTLHEDSAHFLARPVAMRVQPTGGAFILSDIGTNRVSVFSRTGEFQREFGQPGSGPGELEGPAAVFEVGDTLLAVYNMGHRSLLLFDSRSARFLRNIRLPGYPSSAQPLVRRVLDATIALWATDRIGYSDDAAWQSMQETLLAAGMLKEPLDLSLAYTNDYLPEP